MIATAQVLLATSVLCLLFGNVMPGFARAMAMHALLRIRGELYDLAKSQPDVLHTLMYRDVEYLLCLGIHTVRDKTWRDVFDLSESMLPRRRGQKTRRAAPWRLEQYKNERNAFYATPEGADAEDRMMALFQRMTATLVFAAIGMNFALLLFMAFAVPAIIASRATAETLGSALSTGDHHSTLLTS